MPRKSSLPKCPKCKLSMGLTLTDKIATCGYCYISWKPSPSVRERIKACADFEATMRQAKQDRIERERRAAAAKYEKLNHRDANGWLVRDDELDLDKLPIEEQIKHCDRLTRHLDGLAEEGFVDRDVVEPQHSWWCDEGQVCDATCPVVTAKCEQYLASAFREHPGQTTFEDLLLRVSHRQLLDTWAEVSN